MATGPRGGLGTSMSSQNSMFDPSVLFDLDDILMAGDCSNDMHTSLVHTPIKEEPEYDHDDSRYVHSPIGLPIPSRNSMGTGIDSGFASIKQETGGLIGESPAGSMWGAQRDTMIPFPVTPFNTPAHGTPAFISHDLRSFFSDSSGYQFHNHHQHLNATTTLVTAIKEEFMSDIEPNLEVMKDDDIFQVDKADLIQGPTLAELNANDESLLGDLNFDDFIMPGQLAMNGDRSARSYGGSMGGTVNSVGSDRFRMSDLNAAFASSPSLSNLNDLHRARNTLPAMSTEDDYSQLGSVQIGFDLEQLPSVDMGFSGASFMGGAVEVVGTPSTTPSALSASLPANFGHVSLSKLTRRTEEGGRVKPPPPYPTSPPQKATSSASALQELLSIRSPGRLPSPNATGSHSPSPTAQRPSYTGGARQRTTSSSMSSPAPGQNIPNRSPNLAATNPLLLARLSSSAPAQSILGGGVPGNPESSAWQRREPRNRLFSTSSLAEEVHGSASSISTGFDSDDDSDHYEDFDDSDSDSRVSDEESRGEARAGSSSGKKERFFWQYNVQAKGPKGHRISLAPETVDPHVLNKVQDPVFSPYCSVDGIKHSGKARRGDGNDLTPNPRKLHSIGRELDKLNRLINDMTPVSELPMAIRPKSRKEKNKLASRACRLKKKAQHEANKVKLYGLEQEHRKLMSAISQAKLIVTSKYDSMTGSQNAAGVAPPTQDASARLDRVIKTIASKIKIAGQSTEFVNRVLERVKAGEPSGGLDEL